MQLCGDAHLSNFGVFASPERQLIFDINDFDETLPGPWEWDVKRLAASFEIAGRDLGFSPADRRGIVLAGVRSTGEQHAPGGPDADPRRVVRPLDVEAITSASSRRSAGPAGQERGEGGQAGHREGADAGQLRAFARRAGKVDGELRIVRDPPIIVPIEDLLCRRGQR